jgi:transposase
MEGMISKAVFMDLMVNFERKLAREKLLEDQLSAAVILIEKQEDTVVNLQFEVNQLKKILFKGKGERFVPFSLQLSLAFDDQEVITVPEPTKEKISYHRAKKKHPGRNALPEHIPVEEIILEPEGITSDMIYIGDEITETLDYKPPVLLKKRYIRRKYALKSPVEGSKRNVVIAELPARPLAKAIAEASLLAHLFTSKFVDHLPFYRQIEMFKRQFGWELHKATLNDWFSACCTLLQPLYECHIKQVFQTDYLQIDESPIKVLQDNQPESSHQGYMWVYRNPTNHLILFDYRKGRGKSGPMERLGSFEGTIQCDGYAVYKSIAQSSQGIRLMSCMAHIRRKFFDAMEHHPKAAEYAIGEISGWYALERKYRENKYTPEERLLHRRKDIRPGFDAFKDWVETQQKNVLSKGAIGKALLYAVNQLPLMDVFFEDGRIHLDNNAIENKIRPLALGRKNFLFAGSHEGAKRIAIMYSFFASCKEADVNPYEWMTSTLNKIGNHSINKLSELLPNNFQKL